MYDYSDFVISIGCDTVILLRKHFCVQGLKSGILRNFLSGVHRGVEILRQKLYTE